MLGYIQGTKFQHHTFTHTSKCGVNGSTTNTQKEEGSMQVLQRLAFGFYTWL